MSKHVTRMTLEDAEHYTPEQRAAIIESYPPHERRARVEGLPALGSGHIFPYPEDDMCVAPFPIPPHWPQIIGVDFGFDHPFAAVSCAWNRDDDVWYVVRTYRAKGQPAAVHAAAIGQWGDWAPVAWPHDGLQHDKGSGLQLAEQYRNAGLNMLHEHATHEAGGFGLEAGVAEMSERMVTGRWKVFDGANEPWWEEYRMYHREDGLIVKEKDDALAASRYALMMRRFAECEPERRARSRVNSGGSRFGFMG